MEFSELGNHCSVPTCHQLDFLPFTCKYCNQIYCLTHRTGESHDCKEYQKAASANVYVASTSVPSSNKCELRGCKARDGLAIACKTCRHQYCVRHRFPSDHKCDEVRRRDLADRRTPPAPARAGAIITSSSSQVPVPPPPINCRQEARTGGSEATASKSGEQRTNLSHSRLLDESQGDRNGGDNKHDSAASASDNSLLHELENSNRFVQFVH